MREKHFWLLQLIAGVVIFFLLGTHLTLMHLVGGEPASWTSMIERAVSNLWLVFYIILLPFILYHGLYGLRNVLLELSIGPAMARKVTAALIVLGVVAFALGTYVPVKLFVS